MSEQPAPYGPYSDIPAKVDQLRNVQRVMIDRFDGLESRFTALEAKMDTRLTAIEENQRVMTQMLAEILKRLPGWPPTKEQEQP